MKKILIVDDDAFLLEAMKKCLACSHIEVETASNGLEALELMRRNRYDLLLTDYQMGMMNGLELVNRVQADRPGLSIMVMTSENFRELFTKAGIVYFFAKPIEMSRIKDTIARLLQINGNR
jgi:DNA-binding NtrC family response regulator